MVPFGSMVMWTFRVREKIVWKSGKIAFLFSVIIEMLQLLLRLGTFQIADICYNTVGGVLGGVCYWTIRKLLPYFRPD